MSEEAIRHPDCFKVGKANCFGDYQGDGVEMCDFCEWRQDCKSGIDSCDFCDFQSECEREDEEDW